MAEDSVTPDGGAAAQPPSSGEPPAAPAADKVAPLPVRSRFSLPEWGFDARQEDQTAWAVLLSELDGLVRQVSDADIIRTLKYLMTVPAFEAVLTGRMQAKGDNPLGLKRNGARADPWSDQLGSIDFTKAGLLRLVAAFLPKGEDTNSFLMPLIGEKGKIRRFVEQTESALRFRAYAGRVFLSCLIIKGREAGKIPSAEVIAAELAKKKVAKAAAPVVPAAAESATTPDAEAPPTSGSLVPTLPVTAEDLVDHDVAIPEPEESADEAAAAAASPPEPPAPDEAAPPSPPEPPAPDEVPPLKPAPKARAKGGGRPRRIKTVPAAKPELTSKPDGADEVGAKDAAPAAIAAPPQPSPSPGLSREEVADLVTSLVARLMPGIQAATAPTTTTPSAAEQAAAGQAQMALEQQLRAALEAQIESERQHGADLRRLLETSSNQVNVLAGLVQKALSEGTRVSQVEEGRPAQWESGTQGSTSQAAAPEAGVSQETRERRPRLADSAAIGKLFVQKPQGR